MKDRLELAMERIDQQAGEMEKLQRTVCHLRKVRDELVVENRNLTMQRDDYSHRYHRLSDECSELVLNAHRKHVRCAAEHGCPQEFAV